MATASGLAANLLGFTFRSGWSPRVTRIGAASLALGLMAAGAGMQFGLLTTQQAADGVSAVHPPPAAAADCLGHCAPAWLDPVQTAVLLAFSALPTASSCYVLAARMGYNGAYVAGLVTLSTMLGLLSLTLALGVLR